MLITPIEIISDAEIERVHAHANFGGTPKRDVVNTAVLHTACGWHSGSTAREILIEHGLARPGKSPFENVILTPLGRKYLFAALRSAKVIWPSPPHTEGRDG